MPGFSGHALRLPSMLLVLHGTAIPETRVPPVPVVPEFQVREDGLARRRSGRKAPRPAALPFEHHGFAPCLLRRDTRPRELTRVGTVQTYDYDKVVSAARAKMNEVEGVHSQVEFGRARTPAGGALSPLFFPPENDTPGRRAETLDDRELRGGSQNSEPLDLLREQPPHGSADLVFEMPAPWQAPKFSAQHSRPSLSALDLSGTGRWS